MHRIFNKLIVIAFCIALFPLFSVHANAAWIPDPFVSKETQTNRFMDFAEQYPDKISYESIGKTLDDKDIWLFKIGNLNGARVMWDAYLHGTEDYGSEMMYDLTKWLLTSNSEEANKILAESCLLFIPVILASDNPNVGRYNLNNVNLNRNFKTGWHLVNETVNNVLWINASGTSPASEPETQALRDAFSKWRPIFYVNLHQGIGPCLYSYRGSNQVLASQTKTLMTELAIQRGVTLPQMRTIQSQGFSIGDAGSEFGSNAWLWEIDTGWNHESSDYTRLIDNVLPQFKVALIAMTNIAGEMNPSTTPKISTTYPTTTCTSAMPQTPVPSTSTSLLTSPLPSEPGQSQESSLNSGSTAVTNIVDSGFPVIITMAFIITLFLLGIASLCLLKRRFL